MPVSQAVREARISEGLCPEDGRLAAPFVRCAVCRNRRVKQAARAYKRAINDMRCVVPGCGRTPVGGLTRCAECRQVEIVKAAQRRAERKVYGLCAHGCGRAKSSEYETCGRCRLAQRNRS